MKKNYSLLLVFAIIIVNVLPFNSIIPVVRAQDTPPQPAFETDSHANTIRDEQYRYNYLVDENGTYHRVILDVNNSIIQSELVKGDPYSVSKLKTLDSLQGYYDGNSENNNSPIGLDSIAGTFEEWHYSIFGGFLGSWGLIVNDLNLDGIVDIITSAVTEGAIWHVIHATSENKYEIIWTSPKYTAGFVNIVASDINSDGFSEILVALNDNNIHIYNSNNYQEIATFKTALNISKFVVGDTDGFGNPELVISDGVKIAAYNATSLKLLWQTAEYGGDIAIGNVDLDPEPEIVSSKGIVLHGPTQVVEWIYPATTGFGSNIEVGDIDADGIDEIVGAAGWYKITIFEGDLKSPMWEITPHLDISDLKLADVNGDDVLEILYGDGQWGQIHAIDGQMQVELWKISNPDHGVTGIAVGDADRDGRMDVFWGGGVSSSAGDHLFAADIASGTIEWISDDMDGSLYAVDVGDVDDDGDVEILMISQSSNSGYGDAVISSFNAITHELEWQIRDLPGIPNREGANSIRIGDVDQDTQTEFVITTANLSGGLIQIYNGPTHTLERQSAGVDGTFFTAMEIGDADGDSKPEIVVGNQRENTGATGVNIIVYDGATALVEWKSIGLDTYWGGVADVHLADVDGDTRIEILAVLKNGPVYVFDGITHVLDQMILSAAYSLETGDLQADGSKQILVGRASGGIDVINGKTYVVERTIPTSGGMVNCLKQFDIDGEGRPELFACGLNRIEVFYPDTGSLIGVASNLSGNLGLYNHIPVGQIDDDQNLEFLVGGADKLYQFETPWVGTLGLSYISANRTFANSGDEIIYSLYLVNPGIVPILNTNVFNMLPSGLVYKQGSLAYSSGNGAFDNNTLQWNGTIPAMGAVTISYFAIVGQVPSKSVLTNTALVEASPLSMLLSVNLIIDPDLVFLPIIQKSPVVPTCGDYFDDFHDATSGWLVYDDANLTAGYVASEYRVLVKNTADGYLIKAPTCKRQNYIVETDVRWGGNSGSFAGLLFGMADDLGKYYAFVINTDYREFGLVYQTETGFDWVVPETYSPIVNTNYSSNHLKATRNGNQITLELNGSVLGTWTHAGPGNTTNVGIITTSFSDRPYADARYDNFSVTTLPVNTSVEASGSINSMTTTPGWKGVNLNFLNSHQDME